MMQKTKLANHVIVYDVMVICLLFIVGAVLGYFSNGNEYIILFAGAFIGAGMSNLFSSVLTNRVESKINEVIESFDEANALAQLKLEGARPLDSSLTDMRYQYFKTITSAGPKWRLVVYSWTTHNGKYVASSICSAFDTTDHGNVYKAVMITARGCVIIVDTDASSEEPSAISVFRRDIGGPRLIGVQRLTTWKNIDAIVPVIQSIAPIENWSDPRLEMSERIGPVLDKVWKENFHSTFLTR